MNQTRMGSVKQRLRQKFLGYAKKLEKTEPELANNIAAHVDELVTWYVVNERDMTLREFRQILGELEA